MKAKYLLFTLVFVLALALTTSAFAQAKFKWRAGSCWTPAINIIDSDRYFVKIVNEMSGGRLTITHHPAGEIVPAFELFDAVSKGALEGGFEWPSYWTGKNSAFDLLGSVNFWFTPPDYFTWTYHGGGLELTRELFAKYNIHYVPTGMTPSESGFRTNKPIRSLADYKGMTLRTPLTQTMWILEQIGAKPVKIPGGEIYMALKLGTIDGAEFSNVSCDWGMKFQENTKYWNVPCWFQPSSLLGIMINMDAWKKLPADLQAIVEAAGKATVLWHNGHSNWLDIAGTENFKKAGVIITRLSSEDLAKLEKLSVTFMEREAAKNPDYKKIVKSIMTYLKGYAPVRDWQEPFGFGRNPTIYPKVD
ncbi:MAG: TRAP transporter substrate-binding protein DctP [Deltaproteobacteria bacterium]|nr:TRAP transporter substrate-binding protein DctP [Deltaproteobacteria bacterium]